MVGLARSGAAIASVLAERGETVLGVDSGAPEEAAGLEGAGVEVSLGVDGTRQLDRARTLVKSPGVPQDAPVVQAARERGIEVTGELELAWRLIPNAFCAVTGTNGKTTTTELIGHLYRTAGQAGRGRRQRRARRSPRWSGPIDADATVVCEASSFQLEDTELLRRRSARSSSTSPRTTSTATARSTTIWTRSCGSSPTRATTTSRSTTATRRSSGGGTWAAALASSASAPPRGRRPTQTASSACGTA